MTKKIRTVAVSPTEGSTATSSGPGSGTGQVLVASMPANIENESLAPGREVAVQGNVSPEVLISQAIQKGLPVETMERLLAMRKELKQEWAKEEYFKAMATFQAECPIIEKTTPAKDEHGKVMYKYADLDATISQTQELISKNGFSYMFRQREHDTKVEVECIVSHKYGHSEVTSMDSDLATKTRMMSSPQQKAATVTFLKRYAFWNAFGIMTGIEDVDANSEVVGTARQTQRPASEPATDVPFEEVNEQRRLIALLDAYGMPRATFEASIKKSVTALSNAKAKELADVLDKKIAAGDRYATPPAAPATPPMTDAQFSDPAPIGEGEIVREPIPEEQTAPARPAKNIGGTTFIAKYQKLFAESSSIEELTGYFTEAELEPVAKGWAMSTVRAAYNNRKKELAGEAVPV